MEQDFDQSQAVSKIISDSLEKSMVITSSECLTDPDRQAAVYRCFAASEGEPERTFIIKQAAKAAFADENRDPMAVKRFFTDWVGAEFLSSLYAEPPISPRFYGGDLNSGFFVIEDLGQHRSLVQPLLQGDPGMAEAALLKYSACLGNLHAMTAGKAAIFEKIFSARLPGLKPIAYEVEELGSRISQVQNLVQQFNVAVTGPLTAEMQGVIEAVNQPGPFLAYIHGDPCPDNVFDLGDYFRLVDFETGHFGHALWDSVYPRMLWPTCWCANRLPAEIVARMENRYRTGWIRSCPQAQEDAVWETALVNMCGLVILNTLAFSLERALKEDREWGIATIRQRILARLEAFSAAAEEFRRLPALRGAARQILLELQKQWAGLPQLPVYPAFQ